MINKYLQQALPFVNAMKSFVFEDILIVGFDDKDNLIDYQYIGEENTPYSSGLNSEKLTNLIRNKNYKYLLLAHNHPDLPTTPSDDDISFTGTVCKICKDFNIKFLDHLIVSSAMNTFSFQKRNYVKFS